MCGRHGGRRGPRLFRSIRAVRTLSVRRGNFTPALRTNPREHGLASLPNLALNECRRSYTCALPTRDHGGTNEKPHSGTWCTNSTCKFDPALLRSVLIDARSLPQGRDTLFPASRTAP